MALTGTPAPPPAERARSIVARCGPAIVAIAGDPLDGEPTHLPESPRRAHADGSISMLVSDRHTIVPALAAASGRRLEAVVEFADLAPVRLRERTRGLLWASCGLTLLTPATARAAALSIAEVCPDERLLDVGRGASIVSVEPGFLSLADGDGNHGIDLETFAAASEDPLSRWETAWLAHLEEAHPDVLVRLTQLLPRRLRSGRLRPVGLDRFGMRMRVETRSGSHDLRLPFDRPAQTPHDAVEQVHQLIGCTDPWPHGRKQSWATTDHG